MTNEKKTALGWSPQDQHQQQQYAQLLEQHKQQQQAHVQQQDPYVAMQEHYARSARGSEQPLTHAPTQPVHYDQTQAAQYDAYYAQQQQYYAQQQAYQQQQYEQQQYAQYAQQQEQYAQQQAAQQQAARQAAQQQAAQQQYDHALAQQYAAQHHAQQAAQQQQYQQHYAQPQPPPQVQPNSALGGMAATLQKRAEKQKAKLQAALKKDAETTDKRAAIPNADATMGASDRKRFIKKTYVHLFAAIVAFSALLWTFMNVGPVRELLNPFVKFALGGRWNWGIVLLAFMAVSWVADNWASHAKSRKMQYAGLAFYVIAEAIIFVPLLAIVEWKTAGIVAKGGGDPNIVRDAAFLTLGVFGFLTASVVFSKKDFSFLRSGLYVASGAAMTLIVLSLAFGFNLGLVFSVAMVVLAAGYILFQTSQVFAHYDPESHVAASLALFSSVALMFWYMIRILMRARS